MSHRTITTTTTSSSPAAFSTTNAFLPNIAVVKNVSVRIYNEENFLRLPVMLVSHVFLHCLASFFLSSFLQTENSLRPSFSKLCMLAKVTGAGECYSAAGI